MAAHAAALAEKEFAVGDMRAYVADRQEHVGGVAGLATGFGILLGKQRPQPVLVVAVGLFHAGGGPAVALVAGRAAELVGIVRLQQFRIGMAGEGEGILIRFLFALGGHDRGRELDRLARVHVAGLAAVHDVGFGHVDLDDLGVPIRRPSFSGRQSVWA